MVQIPIIGNITISRSRNMKSILLSANFGFQKINKNLILSRIFCSFQSNGYEQYLNPITAKKNVLKELVKQKKKTIGKIWIRLARMGAEPLSHITITQEDLDRTKRQMYPTKKRVMIKRPVRRTPNNMAFFHPMRRN